MKWKGTYRKTGCLLSAFLLANILVKLFFFEIYHVGGHSMRETLLDGDYVLVSKSSYGLRLPRTVLEIPWVNQLFYYTLPENWLEELVPPRGTAWKCIGYQPPRPGDIITFHLPFHPRIVNIKRVQDTPLTQPGRIPAKGMAIDSDTLRQLSRRLEKAYEAGVFAPARQGEAVWGQRLSVAGPAKDSVFLHTYYFVAGDNAPASTDSRQWGLLQEDYIIGKAVCILFSIDNEKRWRKERFFRKLR